MGITDVRKAMKTIGSSKEYEQSRHNILIQEFIILLLQVSGKGKADYGVTIHSLAVLVLFSTLPNEHFSFRLIV